VSWTPFANLPPVSLTPVANCHRCHWHRAGGNFASSIVDTSGKFAPVSTALAKLVAKFAGGVIDTGKFAAGVVDTGGNFATGVVDTGGAPWLAKRS
jgi:hypothetical protein